MKTETYIVEEQNFGDAQTAYEQYAQLEKLFHDRRAIYRDSYNAIISKQIESIQANEMRKIDKMAELVRFTQKKLVKFQESLIQKIDSLVKNIKQLEVDYKTYIKHSSLSPEMRNARKLFEESLILRDQNNLTQALEKAYLANESYQTIASEIKNKWMNMHQSKLGGLFKDMDIVE